MTMLTTPITMQFRTVDGLSIRFAESDEQGDEHALLFSPWPESLLAYASMWQTLTQNVHLIAVDLPGFGHSEGREDVLSPQAMGNSWFSSPTRSAWSNRTRLARTSAQRRCSSRRPRIPAGSAVSSSAPARRHFRSSSASR